MPDDAENARFKELMEEIGLSVRQLAKELGVSKSYVGARSSGTRRARRLDVLALERLIQIRRTQQADAGEGDE